MDCIKSPFDAIAELNVGGTTTTAPGCDLFNTSTSGFAEALAQAKAADIVVRAYTAMYIHAGD